MRVRPTVFADPSALGRTLANRIADGIEAAARDGRQYVLGCPGGRSPMTTYAELAKLVHKRDLDLSRLVIAMMDDYVERHPAEVGHVRRLPGDNDHRSAAAGEATHDGVGREGFAHIPADLAHSCRRFGREIIVEPLSAAAGSGRTIPADALWVPDPADPTGYERRLADAGGVDLFILASGASDGHVAFNPPGTSAGSTTRVVELATTTRRDNLVTFPHLRGLDSVPEHGVTVGIDTIRRYSRSAVMLLIGPDKKEAAARIATADGYDPAWPATVIAECRQPDLYVDKAAFDGQSEPVR